MVNFADIGFSNFTGKDGSVVLSGVAIVFGMLLLFVIIISIFGLVSKSGKNSTPAVKAEKPKKVKPVKVETPKAVAATTATAEDDDIIAVIAAAVYSMYEGTGKKPIIRSIKPVSNGGRSAWATAGIMNNIKSF